MALNLQQHRQAYSQFYTDTWVGNLLVKSMNNITGGNILEIGSGQGSLLKPASVRWKNSEIYSTDIDPNNLQIISLEIPHGKHFCLDATKYNLPKLLGLEEDSIDIALCNPPYSIHNKKAGTHAIIKAAGLAKALPKSDTISADLVFLAQNLRFLKPGGELAIILPDGILTSHRYQTLRRALIEHHCVSKVIELPEKSFAHTEAKTHILILRKGLDSNHNVELLKADVDGTLSNSLFIANDDAIKRLDYSYHYWLTNSFVQQGALTLKQLNASIKRGGKTRADLEALGHAYFHTTDFKTLSAGKIEGKTYPNHLEQFLAHEGDILISRVGKRCLHNVAFVQSGSILYSDCIYRIILPVKYRSKFIAQFKSGFGASWINAYAHGVCSKVISKSDLESFPVPACR